MSDVDALAQFIRTIDGNHTMGTGALAERIIEWQAAQAQQPVHSISGVVTKRDWRDRTLEVTFQKTTLPKVGEIVTMLSVGTGAVKAGDGEAVGYVVPINGDYQFFRSYDTALHERQEFEHYNDDAERLFPEPVYTAPPAAEVNQQLLEALDKLISVAEMCDSWESFPSKALDEARAAIAAAQTK